MSVKAGPPFSLFVDASGDPLSSGYVYIGTANADPITSPIAVYSDAALTVAVAQPIRTLAGVPVANGTPINLFVGGNYSMTVKDRNGITVYTVPSAALSGGDITLATGETIEVQSGANIDMKDGSNLLLGDASGGGVAVVVASSTRITGNWIPAATGADLGSLTALWDAFLQTVKLSSSMTPVIAGGATLGSAALPFAGVTAQAVTAKDVSVYSTVQPSATADLVRMDQLGCLLAGALQTSTTSTAATTNLKNLAGATAIVRSSTGTYTITYDVSLQGDGTAVPIPMVSARDSTISVNVTAGINTASVQTRTTLTGAAVDAAFSFLVFGNPAVTDPIT